MRSLVGRVHHEPLVLVADGRPGQLGEKRAFRLAQVLLPEVGVRRRRVGDEVGRRRRLDPRVQHVGGKLELLLGIERGGKQGKAVYAVERVGGGSVAGGRWRREGGAARRGGGGVGRCGH